MPCNTIQINKIQFNLDKLDESLFKAALKEAGATDICLLQDSQGNKVVSFTLNNSAFVTKDNTLLSSAKNTGEVADKIKRLYSRAAVKCAAAINGWQVQEINDNVFHVIRS